MLPQMMPMPWVTIFFMVFFLFFAISAFINHSPNFYSSYSKHFKLNSSDLPW